MSKHTPGPWHVAAGNQIRSAKHQISHIWMMRNGEGKANAQLIAAAPELFEVLLFIKRGLDSGHIKAPPFLDFSNPNAETLELQHPSALVNSVIAKATEANNV